MWLEGKWHLQQGLWGASRVCRVGCRAGMVLRWGWWGPVGFDGIGGLMRSVRVGLGHGGTLSPTAPKAGTIFRPVIPHREPMPLSCMPTSPLP